MHLKNNNTYVINKEKNNSNLLLYNKIQYLVIELRISVKEARIYLSTHYYIKRSTPQFLKGFKPLLEHPPLNPACPPSFKIFVSTPLFSIPPPFKVFQTIPPPSRREPRFSPNLTHQPSLHIFPRVHFQTTLNDFFS